ncbi:4-alpha-glucanotransferase [Streptomyces bambusae]|uniref:4-alpha-glucanotransferase n=1 Tax=Streptomyces bambusae TaxID=1550616 RepID=A0ABS6ZCB5_9ACTN|nr:4-alpha-glucanotransferase [Streptomyces bambusae]MBW5485366.1 4-alpha-glucanotransferase [Streptomyces bambusae]
MDLARLAGLHGVATSYQPSRDVTVEVPEATVRAVLGALGVDASTPQAVSSALAAAEAAAGSRLLPPVLVQWAGGAAPAALAALPPGTRLRLEREEDAGGAGDALPAASWPAEWSTGQDAPLPAGPPPLGVHRLYAVAPDGRTGEATLVVAPERAPAAPERAHGLLVQLYSLLSERSWGMGDLGDLAALADWAGRTHGTGFLQINPLHTAVPGTPTDPSPYRPSSRRYADPVYLRIEDIPEYAQCTARTALAALADQGAVLRQEVLDKGALIDRDAVWAVKRAALELLYAVPRESARAAAYERFRTAGGAALAAHAGWCALAERHGPDPQTWPRSAEPDPVRADFHCWLAWLTDTQLAAAQAAARDAGMSVGLVHDLAVGVHPGGADVWSRPDLYAPGMTVGAPPDAFNAHGQDWGLPPWRPDTLAASGYAPYRALLRALFRHAGALRIDHVMGLFRLWWVPRGTPPAEGAYVAYDGEAMLALLVLEAHRAGTVVIGEDLGTVEPRVRHALARRGVLGTSVLWFERDWDGDGRPLEPGAWRGDCLATVTTHDLPPTAAKLTGGHVELRDRLGLLARPVEQEKAEDAADTAEWLAVLEERGLDTGGEEAAVQALYRFLVRTPARLVGVWLPDAVGDRRPQNLPGTWDQYPNWRLPVADAAGRPVSLERLTASQRAGALLRAVAEGVPPGP